MAPIMVRWRLLAVVNLSVLALDSRRIFASIRPALLSSAVKSEFPNLPSSVLVGKVTILLALIAGRVGQLLVSRFCILQRLESSARAMASRLLLDLRAILLPGKCDITLF